MHKMIEEAAALALKEGATTENSMRLSIAISLKRIADALTGDGENILTRPLNAYGEGIGECIQGQLERGNRQ